MYIVSVQVNVKEYIVTLIVSYIACLTECQRVAIYSTIYHLPLL